jgi:hypothetical protein
MAKALIHARASVRRYGGIEEDYLPLHELMDETKKTHATVAHRAVFHSSYGVWLVEMILGRELLNSDGKKISTRQLAEEHVIEDLGFIPSLDQWLSNVELQPWMAGSKTKSIPEIVD